LVNRETYAYVAGLFDGEGHVSIAIEKPSKERRRITRSHSLRLTVTNTNYEVIHWLQGQFGGHISEYQKRERSRRCWAWRLNGNQACVFLMQIRKYLRIKAEHAEIAINFQTTKLKTRSNRSPSPEELERRDAAHYALQARNLGKAGVDWTPGAYP
jgi:hypothetical protein